jgi:putative acetyltransferase
VGRRARCEVRASLRSRDPSNKTAVTQFLIREAVAGDAARINAIHAAAVRGERGGGHYSDAQVDAWAQPRDPSKLVDRIATRRFLIAQDDAEPVAYGQLDPDAAVVRSIYVRPEYQCRGLGRQLALALVESAREAGLQGLELDASLNSVLFYEALGFRRMGDVEHRFASGVAMPCVRMALDLVDDPGGPDR